MYTRNLAAFVQAADCGSFTKAADQFYTTPASLMNQVNALEARLGAQLFIRTQKGLKLTPAGTSLYNDGVSIIRQCNEAFGRAREIAGSKEVTLRVGSSIMNPCSAFMGIWRQFEKKYPQFLLQVVSYSDAYAQVQSLLPTLGNDIDFIIGTQPSSIWRAMCRFVPIGEYPVTCVLSRNHRLASKEVLEISDFYGEDLIIGKGGDMDVRHHIFEYFSDAHPKIRVHGVEFYELSLFNTCARTNQLALTAAPWPATHPAVVNIPINWGYTTYYGILYSKTPASKMEKFVETLKVELGLSKANTGK